ncbi:DNA repair protein RecO [Chitinimonas sp.]|uniref:DNA repair protein RecO n=1 Tax=Chitinimonas sp. TaxID=1934313 RepID=UPI0035AFEEA6
MASRLASSRNRVDLNDAWLLHSYPYKETSLIAEVFSRQYGRVAMVARGARRPASALRGQLMAFQPLQLSWFGAAELKTLHALEWQGGVPQLAGLPLICGFYLNELLLRLLAREDECAGLFDAYGAAVRALAHTPVQVEPVLRRFELALLAETGYGIALDCDAAGHPIDERQHYRFVPGHGLLPAVTSADGTLVSGTTLLAMARQEFPDAECLQQAKWLMRGVLNGLLGEASLHTRKLLRDLQHI